MGTQTKRIIRQRADQRHGAVISTIKCNPAMLLGRLGISDYSIGAMVVEPHALNSLKEYAYNMPSPDMVLQYTQRDENGIIVVEVKGKAPSNHIPGFGCGQDTLTKLSEQVGLWKNLLGSERGRRDLSTILGGQIPLAELKKCKLRVVGLTGTRKGKGIKILTDYELVN
mgnify:FL=1|jgi:hypothetical protein